MTATSSGPDFIALQVRDVEKAALFYEDHLGLPRAATSPPGAVVFTTKPIPFAVREPLPGVDLDPSQQPGVGVSLWFPTGDAQLLHDRLVEAGIRIVKPIEDGPFGRTFTLLDPMGYAITMHQV